MNVKISDFGDVLVSRPAGKEAFLAARVYFFLKYIESFGRSFSPCNLIRRRA